MTIYLCPNDIEGILCGVYDAWMSKRGHSQVKLQIEEGSNREMFCDYLQAEVSSEKVEKVMASIQLKISQEALELVCRAALSCEEEKADRIYRFLIFGFHYGKAVVNMLQVPEVFEVFRMSRQVGCEEHLMRGFVRFSQTSRGVLAGKIGPKHDLLILLAPYFADRLSCDNWILYDEKRGKAAIHPAGSPWFLARPNSAEQEALFKTDADDKLYEQLWKTFYKSIAIRERTNPNCQRSHLPFRFRPYMTEFQD